VWYVTEENPEVSIVFICYWIDGWSSNWYQIAVTMFITGEK